MPIAYYVNRKFVDYDIDLKRKDGPDRVTYVLLFELLFLPFLFLAFGKIYFSSAKASTPNPISANSEQTAVLGESTNSTPTAAPTEIPIPTSLPQPTFAPTPTPTPEIPKIVPKKLDYKIAVFGDSMVDTMGERLEYLEHALKRKYPGVNFTLYNYGKGAENVEMGIGRLESELRYQDRIYPALTQVKPDVLIIGSFAYNPFSPYIRDRHWIGLTKLIEQAKNISSSVYMLAEIAPLRSDFGKGPNGVNWDGDTAYVHSGHIIEQLDNAVNLAKDLKIPLIDVYHASGGNKSYVNPSDGIHPSVAGHEFTAERIASSLAL